MTFARPARSIVVLTGLWLSLVGATGAHAEVRSRLAYDAFIADVVTLTRAHLFDALDDKAERLRTTRARSADGSWQLTAFHDALWGALQPIVADEEAWPVLVAQLRDVAGRHPTSRNAWLMLAEAYDVKAWSIRGEGFAASIPPERSAPFRRWIAEERRILDDHRAVLSVNPHWYAARIRVAVYLGEGDAAIDALFAEGARREPRYTGTFMAALDHRKPLWGGSLEAMAAFIGASARFATPDEGTAQVVRLARYADRSGYYKSAEMVPWPLMVQSIFDVLSVYPDDWNAQAFLLMACERADRTVAKRIAADIREEASPALLKRNLPLFDSCKSWALVGEPFHLRDPETGTSTLLQ